MGQIIQMVWTSPTNCLFLEELDEKGILTFRSSANIKLVQKEQIKIDEVTGICYTNMYNFHSAYLQHVVKQQDNE